MKWIQTHALTARQQEQIRSLQETCRRAEPFGHSVFLSGELNHFGEMDCFFLGYEGQALAAVLTLFQPDAREAEVTAFVRPDLRRQGRFTALFAAARAELERFGVSSVLFFHEPVCASGGEVLKRFPVERHHTEYLMEYDRTAAPAVPVLPLELEPATRELLPRLAELSTAAFGDAAADSREKVERFFTAPAVSGYAARLDGRVAGHLFCNTEGGEAYLCDFCVEPALQGRGIGRSILALVLARVRRETELPIRLEVDAVNDRALGLYTACGFRETARCDYWRMAL